MSSKKGAMSTVSKARAGVFFCLTSGNDNARNYASCRVASVPSELEEHFSLSDDSRTSPRSGKPLKGFCDICRACKVRQRYAPVEKSGATGFEEEKNPEKRGNYNYGRMWPDELGPDTVTRAETLPVQGAP